MKIYSADIAQLQPKVWDEGLTFTVSFPAPSRRAAKRLIARAFPSFILTSEPTLRSEQ